MTSPRQTQIMEQGLNQNYYLSRGALFNVIGCTAQDRALDKMIEVEICGDNDCREIQLFANKISTLSDEFITVVYEIPKRAKTAVTDNYRDARIFKPNRLNKKDFPVDVLYLFDDDESTADGAQYNITAWDSTEDSYKIGDYVRLEQTVYVCTTDHTTTTSKEPGVTTDWEDDWDVFGEVVDIKHFFFEDSGSGPHASDSGMYEEREVQTILDTANFNYLFALESKNATTVEYGVAITLGVPGLL